MGASAAPAASRKAVDGLQKQLDSLPNLDREQLLRRFSTEYGRPAPAKISRTLLVMAVAYRMQEQAFGGLSPGLRQRLIDGKFGSPPSRTGPGTVLLREWGGKHHTVTVMKDGVEYGGDRYRSLSEVAQAITGVKRSGPAFFGLKEFQRGRA